MSALLEDMLELGTPEKSENPDGERAGHKARHVMLIIDDYHYISEATIHEGMIFLLEHLPATLHLMLASRVNPSFPLARWRLHGFVEEIRVADLRFTHEETERS